MPAISWPSSISLPTFLVRRFAPSPRRPIIHPHRTTTDFILFNWDFFRSHPTHTHTHIKPSWKQHFGPCCSYQIFFFCFNIARDSILTGAFLTKTKWGE
jgi:hypothetical protein